MTGQNMMVGMMAQMPSAQDIKKAQPEKSYTNPFKDIFQSAVSKTNVQSSSVKSSNPVQEKTTEDKNSDPKPVMKSYREVKQNQDQHMKTDESRDTHEVRKMSGEDQAAQGKDEVKDTKSKEDAAVETLAQMLGVGAQDLEKLLKSLNIDPKDLSSTDKLEEITNKLAGVLGLNDQQKQALSGLLKTVQTNLNEKNSGVKTDAIKVPAQADQTAMNPKAQAASKGTEDWVKLDHPDVQVVKVQDFSKVMEQMKAKIQELSQKLQMNPQSFTQELSAQVKEALSKLDAKAQSSDPSEVKAADPTAESQNAGNVKGQENQTAKAEGDSKQEDKKQQDSKDSQPKETKAVSGTEVQNAAVKTDANDTLQSTNVANAQTQKVETLKEAAKVHRDAPVQKSDILNQVVEKAKVVLTGDKSEMSMDLKPESLGKLSLKVVTESGIVVAKFVAESQQVKETLEANMQLLKDTLEKQGLSVQGFSVSVQQDSTRNFGQGTQAQEKDSRQNRSFEEKNFSTVGVAGTVDAPKAVNAYQWAGSSFNFTA